MAKLTKKAQREAAEKAALRQRLADLAEGAYGDYQRLQFDGEDFHGMAFSMGMDAFGRWLGGIKNALLSENREYLIKPGLMEHFDDLDKAVEHLYSAGVRA